MKGEITFPVRKIKIISADVEIDVTVSEAELDRLYQVFQEQEMEPIMRLVVRTSSGGRAEFTNLQLIPTKDLVK